MNISSPNESHRYLITIGSPNCPNMKLEELRRVEPDIRTIRELFNNEEQDYEWVNTISVGETSSEIKNQLTSFFTPSRLNGSDNVIVYYAGHGGHGGKFGSHYLFTVESRKDKLSGTAIKTSDLVNCLFENFENIDPPSILLILDVCYAGQGEGEAIKALSEGITRVRSRNQGSGFWVIASSDARTEVPDGAFVDVLREVMKDRQWISKKAQVEEFLSPLELKDEINKRLEKKQFAFKAEGSVFGNKTSPTFICLHRQSETSRSISLKGVDDVIDALTENHVVPFLGADINLCDRKLDLSWNPDSDYPPSNDELAAYLDKQCFGGNLEWFQCPICDDVPAQCPVKLMHLITRMPLGEVSQSVSIDKGPGELAEILYKVAKREYTPNRLHKFFASLPRQLNNNSNSSVRMLIVTAAFDSTLELAFKEENQAFDLYSYIQTDRGGKFDCKPFRPSQNNESEKSSCPQILKLYGPTTWTNTNSFVITEDQYIDYLAHSNIEEVIPDNLLKNIHQSHIWFLGYSLNHWCRRVILHRLWKKQDPLRNWWVLLLPYAIREAPIWTRISKGYLYPVIKKPLEQYVTELENRVKNISNTA